MFWGVIADFGNGFLLENVEDQLTDVVSVPNMPTENVWGSWAVRDGHALVSCYQDLPGMPLHMYNSCENGLPPSVCGLLRIKLF